MFTVNRDFPSDHKVWRNKNPDSQVNGTVIDGRWQYFCKDIDQGFGRYPHGPADRNTLDEYIGGTGWSTLFLTRAYENAGFRALFFTRSYELLNTTLSPAKTIAELEAIRTEREPEMDRQVDRWARPPSVGTWNTWVDDIADWLLDRHFYYKMHIDERSGAEPGPSCGNGVVEGDEECDIDAPDGFVCLVNCTLAVAPPEPVCGNAIVEDGEDCDGSAPDGFTCVDCGLVADGGCFEKVADMPVTCSATITSDTVSGSCRTIVCGGKQVKACDKTDNHTTFFLLRKILSRILRQALGSLQH